MTSDVRPNGGGNLVPALLCSGIVTGIVDGLFAIVQSVCFYNSTATRLWQGVASTLLGRAALDGGVRTAAIGLLMHFGVAFAWSAVFLFVLMRRTWIRRALASSGGVLMVAAVYGPVIWIVMSLAVIPALTQRPPARRYLPRC
jgi:hypothetical protein